MNELHKNIQRIYDELFERPNDPLSVKQLSELTGIPINDIRKSIDIMWDFNMVEYIRCGVHRLPCIGVPKWRYYDQLRFYDDGVKTYRGRHD